MVKLAIEKPLVLSTNSSGIILSEKKLHIDRIDQIILSDIACGLMTIADEEDLLDLGDTASFLLVLLLEEVLVAETTCKRCRNRLLASPDKPNILIV